MKHLLNFIFSSGITVTKTKSGKGLMIYTPSQVTDLAKLTSLCNSVGWKVISSDDEWDRGTKVRSAAIYVGPVKSSLDITSKDELQSYLESQA
tara:strand:- start:23 stop:301 length:279 start_codon:yes stop_codon:yes gene_type:complete